MPNRDRTGGVDGDAVISTDFDEGGNFICYEMYLFNQTSRLCVDILFV